MGHTMISRPASVWHKCSLLGHYWASILGAAGVLDTYTLFWTGYELVVQSGKPLAHFLQYMTQSVHAEHNFCLLITNQKGMAGGIS